MLLSFSNKLFSTGASEACRVLFDAGCDTTLGDKDGLTALHCAASRGHLDCMDVLLNECSVNVDARDRHECTPLMYASTLGFVQCIARLARFGANKDQQDRKGRRYFCFAFPLQVHVQESLSFQCFSFGRIERLEMRYCQAKSLQQDDC